MNDSTENRQRDADVLRILGAFFGAMGLLVLIGTIWSWGSFRATVVNIAAGSVLLGIAIATLFCSRRLSQRSKSD